MYVSYRKHLSEFHERYYELIQEYAQIQVDFDEGRLPHDVFWRLEQALMMEQNDLKEKIQQYHFYDIYDLVRVIIRDEFRSLSNDLV